MLIAFYYLPNFFFFKKKVFCVEHIQVSYFGATGTPVLEFW